MNQEILRQVPLFSSLPEDRLADLAADLQQRELAAGSLLMREGETGGSFYIVIQGEVEVIKALGTPDERLLANRGIGAFLGEMSLFSQDHDHTASVRARTPVQILEMTRDDLDRLLRRQPSLAYEVVRTLSRRLEESENLTIRELREKNRQLQQAYDELKAAQAQIIEKEKLEREMELARDIQLSILPRELPQNASYAIGAQMVPMRAVGGDFYDVLPFEQGTVGVAVGDVAGHGVPAALFMALTATLLRAEAKRTPSPGDVLQAVNRQLLEMSDSGMFATVLYGVLDPAARSFRYARAGHSMPICVDADMEPSELSHGLGQPLGVFEEMLLDEGSLHLAPSSLLLMFTDGITEAANQAGDFFGEERLLEAIRTSGAAGPQELCDALWERLKDYQGEEPQDDDVTLLAVGTL